MHKGRRVGTLTTGVTLIIFGLLFLGRLIFPALNYTFIMSLWPLILLFLGIEVVVSYIADKEDRMRYDVVAVILIIIMAVFAMCMGGAEFIIEHTEAGKFILSYGLL